jgi:hypothetical protein
MSVLIEKIIDKYSPFIGKKELNNIELNKKLISNNNQFNHFLHQHNVFIHINSNTKKDVIMDLCIWISTEYYKLDVNKNFAVFNYIMRCKNIMNKLKSCYMGYSINFYDNFCKDILKIMTKPKIIDYIFNEFKKDNTIKKILFKQLSNLFENKEFNLKFKNEIIRQYLNKMYDSKDPKKFNKITITNYLNELSPLLNSDDDKNLFKIEYFKLFLQFSQIINFVDYEILYDNFIDVLKIIYNKDKINSRYIITVTSHINNYMNEKFFLVIATIIQSLVRSKNYKILEEFRNSISNNEFLEYICVILHNELSKKKINNDIINEYIILLLPILKLMNEYYLNNLMQLKKNKVIVLNEYYINFLKKRIIFSSTFNYETEEMIYLNLNANNDLNFNKLESVLNDIKVSITCNNKLKNTHLSFNNNICDSLLKDKFDNIKHVLKPMYFTKYSNRDVSLFKLKSTSCPMLDLGLKISKNNLKQRLMHDSKIYIADTDGLYDFNAKINQKQIRIKSNLREFYLLNNFPDNNEPLTLNKIHELEVLNNYKNSELEKTLYKLVLVNLVIKVMDGTFKLNYNIKLDEINLFEYSYQFKETKKKEEEESKERTINDKLFILQAHIIKAIKPYSDTYVQLDSIYNYCKHSTEKYFEIEFSIFLDALCKLYKKELCKIVSSDKSAIHSPVKELLIEDLKSVKIQYIV